MAGNHKPKEYILVKAGIIYLEFKFPKKIFDFYAFEQLRVTAGCNSTF